MRGFSKAIITGNLTRDPELRTTSTGSNVCSFTVAVNRNFKVNGEDRETVSFLDCSAWGKAADIINQYGHKGTGILVSGRLDQHSWTDQASGQKRSRVEITVEDFNFMDSPRREDGGNNYGGGNTYGGGAAAEEMAANAAPIDAGGAPAAPAADVLPTDVPPDGEIDMGDLPF